ncbi:NAD(+) diphosphatase [Mesorhizobium xinjiangense]|uniref:NAD(+) diphosphatase n=1 Tax=Mesorhizobium xinjiangense TaxID=2678685 RepID=UPI0012ED7BF7|nr:NAD(+) diphosphatase [Mesorhizobium xinjiangense]
MPFRLFDAPPREPSQFVGFAGNEIESLSEKREDDGVTKALADPAARLMLMRGGRAYLRHGTDGLQPWHDIAQAKELSAKLKHAVLMGWNAAGAPVLGAPAGIEPEALPDTIKAIDYRSVFIQGLLSVADLGALAQAASLLAWHSSHRFCSRCGNPSEMRAAGCKRVCPNCQAQHFPRTDPVAIMLAVRADACVLGRSPHFQPNMYSCLAGFIEPGETIENAVRRETFEESGLRIGRVVYHASQPWPFPHSLMIGCFGEALDRDIRRDEDELEDCRWFPREEVRAMLSGTHRDGLAVPPPGAIAHHLIKAWAESDS